MWDIVSREEPNGVTTSHAPGPAPEDGEYWYDALKRIKDGPDPRYAMARRHLPLPAAWRDIADEDPARKEEKSEYDDLLRELHHLAAMSSYAGYGIIERIPYSRLAALDLAYDRVGSEQLSLLGVTNRKWMKELWCEPSDIDAVDGSSAGIAMCQDCGVARNRMGGAIHGRDYHDWTRHW